MFACCMHSLLLLPISLLEVGMAAFCPESRNHWPRQDTPPRYVLFKFSEVSTRAALLHCIL